LVAGIALTGSAHSAEYSSLRNEAIGQTVNLDSAPRLRFVVASDFPPFGFTDSNGKIAGFNVDLVREVCAELKIVARCELLGAPFSTSLDLLRQGQAEAAVTGVGVTAGVRTEFGISDPFIRFPAWFAATATNPDQNALATERRVGVLGSTAHEAMLRDYFPQMRAVVFTRMDWMLDALKQRRVDQVFADGMSLSFWIAGEDSASCCTLLDGPYFSDRYLGSGLSFITSSAIEGLDVAINQALAHIQRSGRLDDIRRRYFPIPFD
jgi:polar amino acid transport system substrate-binding protein